MELRQRSSAARQVWDAADRHLIETFGFSIIDIVQRNPKSLTIHFGGEEVCLPGRMACASMANLRTSVRDGVNRQAWRGDPTQVHEHDCGGC